MQAALSFSASVKAAGLSIGTRRPARAHQPAARRAPPSLPRPARARAHVAVRAAAKSYICVDCGWLYVPANQKGVAFESLKSFK